MFNGISFLFEKLSSDQEGIQWLVFLNYDIIDIIFIEKILYKTTNIKQKSIHATTSTKNLFSCTFDKAIK